MQWKTDEKWDKLRLSDEDLLHLSICLTEFQSHDSNDDGGCCYLASVLIGPINYSLRIYFQSYTEEMPQTGVLDQEEFASMYKTLQAWSPTVLCIPPNIPGNTSGGCMSTCARILSKA